MPRLNPKQIENRARSVLLALGDAPDDQRYDIVDKAGEIDRYVAIGRVTRGAVEGAVIEPLPAADDIDAASGTDRERMLEKLRKRGEDGDVAAAKLWLEMTSASDGPDQYNIKVVIEHFKIPDEKMEGIGANAPPSSIEAHNMGVARRLEIDESPHELRTEWDTANKHLMEWMAVAYAPKDA